MKIAIITSYGIQGFPDVLIKNLPADLLGQRVELARRIEALPFTHKEPLDESQYEDFKKIPLDSVPIVYVRTESMPNSIVVRFKPVFGQNETDVRLVEIDTTVPWRINDYDGFEFVEYLPKPNVLDPESNYSEW